MKHFLSIILTLTLSMSAAAEVRQDFVGLLVNTLQESGGSTAAGEDKDYECVTVSPNMMGKVFEQAENSGSKQNEQLRKVLPNIKSLRIFTASRHANRYSEAAEKLLSQYSTTYKPYRGPAQDKRKPCIWLRKNKARVIEIIMLTMSKGEETFQVLNFTGNMTKEFVTDLLKI